MSPAYYKLLRGWKGHWDPTLLASRWAVFLINQFFQTGPPCSTVCPHWQWVCCLGSPSCNYPGQLELPLRLLVFSPRALVTSSCVDSLHSWSLQCTLDSILVLCQLKLANTICMPLKSLQSGGGVTNFWILSTNGNTEWGKYKTANLDVIGLITQLSAFLPC